MPETVLERHYRDRMQSVREIAEYEASHAALSGRVFQDLATLCFELSESGRQLMELEYKRSFKEPNLTVAWLQERRRTIEELSNTFLEIVESIKNSACQVAGPLIGKEPVGRLDEAIRRIVEAKQSVLERWLVGSPREIAEARLGDTPGDYLAADEAFAQIAGVDVETWRKRVEKHKQTCPD